MFGIVFTGLALFLTYPHGGKGLGFKVAAAFIFIGNTLIPEETKQFSLQINVYINSNLLGTTWTTNARCLSFRCLTGNSMESIAQKHCKLN